MNIISATSQAGSTVAAQEPLTQLKSNGMPLPVRVQAYILSFLPNSDLVSCMHVCKTFRLAVTNINKNLFFRAIMGFAINAADKINKKEGIGKCVAYRNIAELQARAGDILGAISNITCIRKMEYESGDFFIKQIYEIISRNQAQSGHIEDAAAMASNIEVDSMFRQGAETEIALCQAREGKIEDAKKTAAGIGDPCFSSRAYALIAQVLAESSDPEVAVALLSNAVDMVPLVENGFDNTVAQAYMAIAQTQIALDDFSGAKEMARRITSSLFLRCQLYATISCAQKRKDDFQGASETMELAIKTPIENPLDVYVTIAKVLATAADIEGAKKMIDLAIQKVGALKNDSYKISIFLKIASIKTRIDDVTEARIKETIEMIERARKIMDLVNEKEEFQLKELLDLARDKREQEAIRDLFLFPKQVRQEIFAKHLAKVARIFAKISDTKGAWATAVDIKEPYGRAKAFVNIGKELLLNPASDRKK